MPAPELRLLNGEHVLTIYADIERVIRAFERIRASLDELSQRWRDFADPPSRERRELRLIARAERAEARLWWEQHKATGRR
ncbi:hypothetical protein QE370_000438 [Aeromicrobium sp. SORGH_AS981]|uniref:hypothetical protein n=1 Tax=Aeromicrobium sp. SORGH_AS_0981 TaxID=3041802 RepID=UPI00285C63B9|nr:hypothetical protein [Aeromicrobium sp. SORGH_AS_0981]MDR6117254.1 hypothetical protein [Aeromicrobium sp. SORGH_AS_0981]